MTREMIDPDSTVQARLTEVRPILESAIAAIHQGLVRLGLEGESEGLEIDAAVFSLDRDPSDGSQSLTATWKDERGYYLGNIVVHADSSFFAEYGMSVTHPQKPGWFIDAMTAWGRDGMVKFEPRLLPSL